MKIQMVCLANSFKEGGRCLAGIEIIDSKPVMSDFKPKWIRPVCDTPHGVVPTHLVAHLNTLDIIEIDILESVPDGFQSENVLFDTSSIKKIGTFPFINLNTMCDNNPTVLFGNRGGAVTPDNAELLSSSLRMIEVVNPKIVEKVYPDNPNPKIRLSFTFTGTTYELPVTDPLFLNQYRANSSIGTSWTNVFVVLSLSVEHQGWHSKLVAALFYS